MSKRRLLTLEQLQSATEVLEAVVADRALLAEVPEEARRAFLMAAGRAGGTAPAVFNAANEVAVERFLEQGLSYLDIPRMIETVLASVRAPAAHSLDDVLNLDHEARERAWQWRGRSGRSGHRDTVGTIAIAARS